MASPAQVVEEDARVRAVEDLGVLDTGPEERFDRITRFAQQLFGVETVAVTLIDRDRQWYKSKQGLAFASAPREDVFCNVTIGQPQILVVEDTLRDPRFVASPLVVGAPHVRFYAGCPLQAPSGHRVGTICLLDPRPRTFSPMQRELLEELARWVQHELTNSAELDQAAAVQRALAPRRSPELPDYDLAGLCLPARSVGGDLLDWYPVPNGLALTLADVMGKGLAAAILMATVRAGMRAVGGHPGVADAVAMAARILDADLQETGTLVTLCHARLEVGGRVRWVDAGHGLVVLVRADGTCTRVAGAGLPLGVVSGDSWEEKVLDLRAGDTLLAFSDGLLDLYDGTLDSLPDIARVVRDARDAQAVVGTFATLAGKAPLFDDVAVACIRRTVGVESPSP